MRMITVAKQRPWAQMCYVHSSCRGWPLAERVGIPEGYTPNFSKGDLAILAPAFGKVFSHVLLLGRPHFRPLWLN